MENFPLPFSNTKDKTPFKGTHVVIDKWPAPHSSTVAYLWYLPAPTREVQITEYAPTTTTDQIIISENNDPWALTTGIKESSIKYQRLKVLTYLSYGVMHLSTTEYRTHDG